MAELEKKSEDALQQSTTVMVNRQALLRAAQTLNVDLACVGMGLLHSVTGVALLDLADVYNTDVKNVAQLATTRGVGILVGSFLGGRLYDRYNTQVLSVIMMLLASLSVLLTPLCVHIWYAHAASVLAGVSSGAMDTGANIWLINLWPSNCGPALQIYHFAFGVGAFIAPFITEPFLSTTNASALFSANTTLQNSTNFQGGIDAILLNSDGTVFDVLNDTNATSFEPSQLRYAFGIVSGFNALVALLMFLVFLVDKSDSKPPVPSTGGDAGCRGNGGWFPTALLLLLGAYILVYLGLECSYGQMLPTFAVQSTLHLNKSQAAYLTSLFFLTFTVARVASAFWAMVATPFSILLTCQCCLLATFGALVFFGSSSSMVLWCLTGAAGVSLAAVFATAVSWSVKYLVMTNQMMSVITVAASFGTMISPVVVGLFIEKDAMVLMYVCFVATVIMALLFVAMHLLTRGKAERVPSEKPVQNNLDA